MLAIFMCICMHVCMSLLVCGVSLTVSACVCERRLAMYVHAEPHNSHHVCLIVQKQSFD